MYLVASVRLAIRFCVCLSVWLLPVRGLCLLVYNQEGMCG